MNDFWVVDDPWICYQNTGNIGPVLIQIRMNRFCYQRTGNVGTTTGKSNNGSVGHSPVKTRDNCMVISCQTLRKKFVGCISIKMAVFVKTDHIGGIDKLKAKVFGHDLAVKIFATRSSIHSAGFGKKLFFDGFKIIVQGKIQFQSTDDLVVTVFDLIHLFVEWLAAFCQLVTTVQHIRYFDVVIKTLSRCRRHNITAAFIGTDNIADFHKLLCACQGTSAKFYNFFHSSLSIYFIFI